MLCRQLYYLNIHNHMHTIKISQFTPWLNQYKREVRNSNVAFILKLSSHNRLSLPMDLDPDRTRHFEKGQYMYRPMYVCMHGYKF